MDECYEASCVNVTRPRYAKNCYEVFEDECEVIIEQVVEQQCKQVEGTEFEEQCNTIMDEECTMKEEYICEQPPPGYGQQSNYGVQQRIYQTQSNMQDDESQKIFPNSMKPRMAINPKVARQKRSSRNKEEFPRYSYEFLF